MSLIPGIENSLNVVGFVCQKLGFTPDPHQAALLTTPNPRVILNCTRQWGKSSMAAAVALHRAIHTRDYMVIVAAPTKRQSSELVRKIRRFARFNLGLKTTTDGENPSVVLANGSRIVGVPGMDDNIRGFSAVNMIIVDEAARVPDSLYHTALRPMLATTSGDLWLMSTPNFERGFFHEEWTSKRPWARFKVPATECPRISPDFLAEERLTLGKEDFAQEYMCEFAEIPNAYFNRDIILNAVSPDVKPLFESSSRRDR